MPAQLTPEQRKQRTRFFLNCGFFGLIALLIGPFALVILHGLGALLAIGATVLVAWLAMKFFDVFALMVANWHLKAIKAEAMRNPVETLQTEYQKKADALAQFRSKLNEFMAEVKNFAAKVKDYVRQGLEDAPMYQEQLTKMQDLQHLREQKYIDAQNSLADFAESIRRTDTKWKMACAAQHMSEAAGNMDGDVFDKICIETAIESVQTKLNQSFADLDLALLDDENARKTADKQKLNQLAAPKPAPQLGNAVVDVESVPVSARRNNNV